MHLFGKELNTHEPFVVAEVSCSHGGDLNEMYGLIACAKHCGADAVKFQLYSPDDMTINHHSHDFLIKDGPWAGNTYYDLYARAQTPYSWVSDIFKFAKMLNIPIFASVFSEEGVKCLESVNCPAYKIASFELIHYPLIKAARATGKPIVISTGYATNTEIRDALDAAKGGENILLHCVSQYPAPYLDLTRILDLASSFVIDVGFSDHSLSLTSGYSAKKHGAVMLEKHLTLGKGEDVSFALNADQFAKYVAATKRNAGEIETDSDLFNSAAIDTSAYDYRRSIYAIKEISIGEPFTTQNVAIIRPRFGMHPIHWNNLLRSTAGAYISRGEPIVLEDVQWTT
jgi:sialic acid synthase SpsE